MGESHRKPQRAISSEGLSHALYSPLFSLIESSGKLIILEQLDPSQVRKVR